MPFRPLKSMRSLVLLLAAWGLLPAADLHVTNLNDSGAGSLRQVLAAAADGDRILFDVSGKITLSSGALGIAKSITIQGPGADQLTLSGYSGWSANPAVPPSGGDRILDITGGASVTLQGLRFIDGFTSGANPAGFGPPLGSPNLGPNGAAIRMVTTGTVAIQSCWFSRNFAQDRFEDPPVGGAIYVGAGTLNVIQSSFHDNFAGAGGAICNYNGSVTLTNCTLSGNTAYSGGAFVHVLATASSTLDRCTLADNLSLNTHDSGGLSVLAGSIAVGNSIVAGSSPGVSLGGPNGSAVGTRYADLDPNWGLGGGYTSNGGNLIGNRADVVFLPAVQDQVGILGTPIDPLLQPLDITLAHGGSTRTPTRPLRGIPPTVSPAIDHGVGSLGVDQRGLNRVLAVDSGAYEFVTVALSGNVRIAGTTVAFAGPIGSGSATADGSGNYTLHVPYNWIGTVTPSMAGYVVTAKGSTPIGGSYASPVTADLAGQDWLAMAQTTLSLASGTNPSVFGQTITFTATVASVPAGAGTPTGTVTFSDGATTLGTVALSGGSATFSTALLAVGSHAITATYGGDASFLGSNGALTGTPQVVNRANTVLTASFTPNPSVFGQGVSITASVAAVAPGAGLPTGTVTFLDGGTPIGTAILSGGVASFTASTLVVGSHTLTASYAGDGNFIGSAGSASGNPLVVNKADTSLALASSVNPSVAGQTVTFTATLAAVAPGAGTPTGTVTFLDGGSPIGTATLSGGAASLSTSALAVGSHTLTASYAGDGSFFNGATGSLAGNPQVVNKATSSLALGFSANPLALGQTVTFSATLAAVAPGAGTPTGTVTFLDGGAPIGTATLSAGAASLSTSTLAVGSHTITATYGGDASFNGTTGAAAANPLVVNKGDTSLTVGSSPNPSVTGQTVSFTATILPVPPAAGTATGSVTFLDGGSPIGSVALAGGSATFTTATLGAGSHSITVTYGGDPNFNGASGTLTGNPQVVIKSGTTTTLTGSANPSAFGQAVTFTATIAPVAPGAGTPSGTLTFLDGGTPLVTVNLVGGTATFTTSALAVGNHTLAATYGGDASFNGSTGSLTGNPQVVNKAATSTTLSSSANPSTLGHPLTLTATVAPVAPGAGAPSGTITFLDGGTPIGSAVLAGGVATFTTSALAVGSHTLTATYGGDGSFSSSTGSLTGNPQVVNKALTSTTLAASPNPSNFGQTVTLTAAVSAAASGSTGTVSFLDGATVLGVVPLSAGQVVLSLSTLTVGSHGLSAAYSGDANFAASTSAVVNQVVNRLPVTVTLASAPNPSTYRQAVSFTITVTPAATGTVTLREGAGVLATVPLAGSSATFTLSILGGGSHPLSADYSGDATHAPGSSSILTQVVNRAGTSITLSASPNPSTYQRTVVLSAGVVGGNDGVMVQFFDGSVLLGAVSLSGGQSILSLSTLGVGPHTLTAVYTGDAGTMSSTSAPLALSVGKAAATLTLGGLAATYDGLPKAATATTVPMGLLVTFTYDGASTAPRNAGSYAVAATISDPNYQGSATGTLVIAPGTPMLTWTAPAPIPYGTPLGSAQLNATSPVPGSFTYTPPAGTILEPGSGHLLSVSFQPADSANYRSASASVTLDVGLLPQTLSFTLASPVNLGIGSVPLAATASSGLPVSFASSDPLVASVQGGTLRLNGPGIAVITAAQPGDSHYAPAPSVGRSLTVLASSQGPILKVWTLPDGAVTPSLLLGLRGQATALNGLREVTVNGVRVPVDGEGFFAWAVQLTSGRNHIVVVATDRGNLNTTDTRDVILDPGAPRIRLSAPADHLSTPGATVTFSGSFDPGPGDSAAGLSYAVNGGPSTPVSLAATPFQFTVSLAPGINSVVLTGTTTGGRRASLQRTLTRTAGFTLAVTDPAEDLLTDQSSYTLRGTVADNLGPVAVTLDLGGQRFDLPLAGGAFQRILNFPSDGTYLATVTATDTGGTTLRVQRTLVKVPALAPASYSIGDVQRALQIALGLIQPTAQDLARYDLAPLVDGIPAGDGVIDIDDVMIILNLASGLGW